MKSENEIEKLSQEAFSKFEADVPADAWTNIAGALPVAPAASTSGSQAAGKSTGGFPIGSTAVIISSVALVSVISGLIYFSPSGNESPVTDIAKPASVNIKTQTGTSVPQQNQNTAFAEKENAVNEKDLSGNISDVLSADESNQQFSANDFIEPAAKKDDNAIATSQNTAVKFPVAKAEEPAAVNITESKVSDENNSDAYEEPATESLPEILNESNTEPSLGLIPNVFTPNMDNVNDVFIISGTNLKSLRVTISDQSNKKIHQWNNLHGFWDGKLENGAVAEPGIYFYEVFALSENGTPLTKKGSIRLNR